MYTMKLHLIGIDLGYTDIQAELSRIYQKEINNEFLLGLILTLSHAFESNSDALISVFDILCPTYPLAWATDNYTKIPMLKSNSNYSIALGIYDEQASDTLILGSQLTYDSWRMKSSESNKIDNVLSNDGQLNLLIDSISLLITGSINQDESTHLALKNLIIKNITNL